VTSRAAGSRLARLGERGPRLRPVAQHPRDALSEEEDVGLCQFQGEILVPAERFAKLVEALSGGAAASWVLTNRAGNMISDSYPLGFKLALHRKDLGIALDEAKSAGVPMDVAALVAAQEDALMERGHGDEDVSAVARLPKRSDS